MLFLHSQIPVNRSRFYLVFRQIPFRFYSLPKKMSNPGSNNNNNNKGAGHSRGRGSSRRGNSLYLYKPIGRVGDYGPKHNVSSGDEDGSLHERIRISQYGIQSNPKHHSMSHDTHKQDSFSIPNKGFSRTERIEQGRYSAGLAGSNSKEFVPVCSYDEEFPQIGCSSKDKSSGKRRTRIDHGLEQRKEDINSYQFEISPFKNSISQEDGSSLPTQFGKKGNPAHVKRSQSEQRYSKNSINKNANYDEDSVKIEPFDICLPRNRNFGIRKAYRAKNKGNREEMEQTDEGTKGGVLRPGMVLLKHYLNHSQQIGIIKTCRELGVHPGGFYQPGYTDGAKLRLQMMCLGLKWDPETKYADQRPGEYCEQSAIPHEFSVLVERAIQDAHALIKDEFRESNVEGILPAMSPDICIANFYTTSGRLGLHQDRDESRESISKGLPVVSFSVGDSAEFLYGDRRDIDEAEKVILESGDVLIFGGESRLVFHGVTYIIPNSAPESLLEETNLRPGRLNLTFRQY